MLQYIRNTLGPCFLLLVCPPFAILMWYTNTVLAGSLKDLTELFSQNGFFDTIYQIWAPVFWGSALAWKIILIFAIFQLVLMRILPGKKFLGPITPKGNIPTYKANGVPAFFTTMIVFCGAAYFNIFSATIIYDNLGEILGALNIASLVFCLFLYFKGRYFPSSTDSGTTGNFIFDYYWGTELYPELLGWNLKKFVICRVGMMSWGVLLLSYAAKQQQMYGLSNSMLISVALQLIYLAKFYIWETGYLRSLDIMHDRAGFYTCWGCLVWVPAIYTSPSMYLVLHPIDLPIALAALIFIAGTLSILINYFADRQRQLVRATNGNCTIWGKPPVTTLAEYTTEQGEKKQNLILASGWWGISRHFHYIPELAAAFCWTVPALFTSAVPYFYFVFLTFLLFDRAFRDDKRCAKKYGKYWTMYCNQVPYKIVPFVI